jgi:hypothetical protein
MNIWHIKTLAITFILITAASLGGIKAYLDHYVNQQVARLTQQFAKQAMINYEQVNLSLFGSLLIKSLKIQPTTLPEIQIEEIALSPLYELYDANRIPNFLQLTVKNLTIAIPDSTLPAPWWLKLAKYDAYYLTFHDLRSLNYMAFQADVTLLAEKKQQSVNLTLLINSKHFGIWQLKATLDDASTLKQLLTAATTLPLHNIFMDYTDNGLLPRLFTLLAQRNLMTDVTLQQQLGQKVHSDLQRSGAKLDTSIINGLQKFIQNPRRLTITLEPNPAISLNGLSLLMPENMPQRLNLKVTHPNN